MMLSLYIELFPDLYKFFLNLQITKIMKGKDDELSARKEIIDALGYTFLTRLLKTGNFYYLFKKQTKTIQYLKNNKTKTTHTTPLNIHYN